MTVVRFEQTSVEIAVGRPDLARAIEQGISAAIRALTSPPEFPVVRLRTRRRLAAVNVLGKIAIVRVTEQGLRRLPALVEEIRAQGALGVQLVWDGETPPRERAEAAIFRVLEAARATKSGPPVMLAAESAPVLALRVAIAARTESAT